MRLLLPARIALRQILSRSNSGFVRTLSLLSVAGIAIGVAALLVLSAFMEGFTSSIGDHLSAIHPPVVVRVPGGYPLSQADVQTVSTAAEELEGASGASPVVERTAVAAGTSGEVAGVHVRGVDWSLEPTLASGDRLAMAGVSGEGALLGERLAARLGVAEGDTMRLASTDVTGFSSMGRLLVDAIVPVRVASVQDLGIMEYNSSYVIVDYATASVLFSEALPATSMSVGVADGADPSEVSSAMSERLDDAYMEGGCSFMISETFLSRHGNLFAALGLERLGMSIVLALITVVALLNLTSALNMMALEHRRDTGILRAMGATPGLVLRTGLLQGTMIGASGAVAGVALAVLGVLAINRFFPIRLESSVYWVDVLSGRLDPFLALLVAGGTVAACLAVSLPAALSMVRVSPSEAVRYE